MSTIIHREIKMSHDRIIVKVDSDLEELIPGFLENRKKDLISLIEALKNKNYPGMQSTGHSLKGVGGGYGFAQLSELGAQIENSAKASDSEALAQHIQQLGDYLERVEVVFE